MSKSAEANAHLGAVAGLTVRRPIPFDGERPYLATADVVDGHALPSVSFLFQDLPARAGLVLRPGDVLQAKMSDTDKAVLVSEHMKGWLASTGFAQFSPDPADTDPRFLFQWLQSELFLRQKEALCVGSTQKAINQADLSRVRAAFPEIAVQERIAKVLSAVDETIEQTEALIAKTQQIKAGLMHDLFTRGVTPGGQLRPPREETPQLYKKSQLGWIPNEWDPDTFGARVEVIDPNPSHRYPDEQDEGVPICSTENFSNEDDFDLAKSKLMPPEVLDSQMLRCRFDKDDVVFARKGRIGLARRYGVEAKVFSHTVVLFKARQKCTNQQWLLWLSRSHWFLQDIDRRMNSNSGVPTLGVGFINDVTIPFPEPEEQNAINLRLDGVSQRISEEKAGLAKLRKVKSGLMADLLTGRVQVGPAAGANV